VTRVTQGHQQCHYLIERTSLPIHYSQKQCVYLAPFLRHSDLFSESHKFYLSTCISRLH